MQFPVDMAHGFVHVLFTIVLQGCSHLLRTYKSMTKKQVTKLFDSLVCGGTYLIDEARNAEQIAQTL